MSIRVVTDSTCDLPETIAAEYGVTVIPAYINIGDRSYLDGVELSRREFYEMLPETEHIPMTSAPSPGAFVRAYEGLAAEGATEILSVHISASLSAMLNAANAAAAATDAISVTLFDSTQLTLGTGLLALEAAKAAAEGWSMAEVVAVLEEMAARTYSFAALDTLEFLRRGGRVTQLQYNLGSLLNVKPVLTMYNGELTMERVRTRRRAIEYLLKRVSDLGPLEQLHLLHANALDRVDSLRGRVERLLPKGRMPMVVEVTPVIGAHVGPGAVGLVCVKARAGRPGSSS
ncbi:MAG: DegV family protein [Anaerolineae bacterium]|jgi:DegV family protein with EDD domain